MSGEEEIARELARRASASRSVAVGLAAFVAFVLGGLAWALLSRL